MPKLPKEIEDRFDEEFKYFSGHEMLQTHQGHEIIKSFIATILDDATKEAMERAKKVKAEMQLVDFPKKSPNEVEQDYRKRKRGFQIAKSKFITIFCNAYLRHPYSSDDITI